MFVFKILLICYILIKLFVHFPKVEKKLPAVKNRISLKLNLQSVNIKKSIRICQLTKLKSGVSCGPFYHLCLLAALLEFGRTTKS